MKTNTRKISLYFCLALVAAGAIPIIYAMIVFPDPPHIRDWNYVQKRKIDAISPQPASFSFAVFGDNKNSIATFNSLIDRVNKDDVQFSVDKRDVAEVEL